VQKPTDPRPSTDAALEVAEERLVLGRRSDETGAVRVRLEIEQHAAPVVLEQAEESVRVERVPVGRAVEARREPWRDGEVTVVPVYAEVEMIERRLVLVEELRLVRSVRRQATTATVPLARQRVVIERRTAGGDWQPDAATEDATERTAPGPPSLPSGEQQ
jgi:stress response protein YsnF